jgi:hypothetical protein
VLFLSTYCFDVINNIEMGGGGGKEHNGGGLILKFFN